MVSKEIFTRDNNPTDELQRTAERNINGVKFTFKEVYYLDYDVDENTGIINRESKGVFYTGSQVDRNMKALKRAYHISK